MPILWSLKMKSYLSWKSVACNSKHSLPPNNVDCVCDRYYCYVCHSGIDMYEIGGARLRYNGACDWVSDCRDHIVYQWNDCPEYYIDFPVWFCDSCLNRCAGSNELVLLVANGRIDINSDRLSSLALLV